MFQRTIVEPKLPPRVTIRTRKVVPVTSSRTSGKSSQQRSNGTVRGTIWDSQAALIYAGQLTR